MHQVNEAAAILDGDTSSGLAERPPEVVERVRCMYCRAMVEKSTLRRVPPEPGKFKNCVRLACPGCIKTIVERRKAARASIKKFIKQGT